MGDEKSLPNQDEATSHADGESAAFWLQRGLAYYNQRQWAGAISPLNRALQLDERLASAWALRAAAYYGIGDMAAALVDVEQAIALSVSDIAPRSDLLEKLYELQAQVLYHLGRYSETIKRLTPPQRTQPLTAYQWVLLAGSYRALFEHQEAIAAYRQALNHPDRGKLMDSKAEASWFGIAQYLFAEKAYGDALQASDLALMTDAKEREIWGLRADADLHLRRLEEALAAANHAVEIDERYAYGWLLRARASRALNRQAEARDAYEHTRTLIPINDPQWQRLVLEEARMLLRKGHAITATRFLEAKAREKLGLPQRGNR